MINYSVIKLYTFTFFSNSKEMKENKKEKIREKKKRKEETEKIQDIDSH